MKDAREINLDKAVGVRVQSLREKNNDSREEMAEFLDCSKESVCKYERGVQAVKNWRLLILAERYHVSLDYLISGLDPEDLTTVPSYVVRLFQDADPEELEILNIHMRAASDLIELKRRVMTPKSSDLQKH